jgi:hypothetical protein
MSGWWNRRSLVTRLLMYAVAVLLAFVMAASVGAVAALVLSGNLSWLTGERSGPEEPGSAGEQGKPPQSRQADAGRPPHEKAGAKREQVASVDKQTPYVHGVGEIQANSVEAFLDSHERFLHYDALTSGDIEEMQADQAALKEYAHQATDLRAPQKYREQKDAFLSAIEELHQAAQLAYSLAADPISATQADFDDYERIVNEAANDLQRSNEILGKDYKAIEGVQGINTP